jgi:hypothetical protein
MFEFRLVYQGVLLSSDKEGHHRKHKNDIRRYFHPQLVNLWNTKHPLKERIEAALLYGVSSEPEEGMTGLQRLGIKFKMGGKKLLPIVTHDDFLVCGLDILLLRRDFTSIINSGEMGIPLTQVGPISSMPGWWQKSIRGM